MELNDAQLAFLRGRDPADLIDPIDRIELENLKTPASEQAVESAQEPSPEAGYTEAQAQYFRNLKDLKGVKSEADLSEEEADMLAFWGTVGRDKKEAEDAAKVQAEKPLALRELDEVAIADLPGPTRLEIANAHEVIKEAHRARAEGRHYDVNTGRLDGAILRCRKYLKP